MQRGVSSHLYSTTSSATPWRGREPRSAAGWAGARAVFAKRGPRLGKGRRESECSLRMLRGAVLLVDGGWQLRLISDRSTAAR